MTDDEGDNDDEIAIAGVAYGFLTVANARHVYVQKRHRATWNTVTCKPWIIQRPVRETYSTVTLFSELTNMDEPVIGCQEKYADKNYMDIHGVSTIVLFLQSVDAEK